MGKKKKNPQESKKTEEKNPQKSSAYDVARTCVMDVFQHTPIWFERERVGWATCSKYQS